MWDIRGTSSSGHTIVYKQYSKLKITSHENAKAAAQDDVRETVALYNSHGPCVVVMDAKDVVFRPAIFTYVRACIDNNMPEARALHVVNCSKWVKTLTNFALRLLPKNPDRLLFFHDTTYGDIENTVKAI